MTIKQKKAWFVENIAKKLKEEYKKHNFLYILEFNFDEKCPKIEIVYDKDGKKDIFYIKEEGSEAYNFSNTKKDEHMKLSLVSRIIWNTYRAKKYENLK